MVRLGSCERGRLRRMRRARVVVMQVDRQLQPQLLVRADCMFEKFLLNPARQAGPKIEGRVSDDGLKS
jgi:hypothetical protein